MNSAWGQVGTRTVQEGWTCLKSGIFKKAARSPKAGIHEVRGTKFLTLDGGRGDCECLREAPRVRGRVCKNGIKSGRTKTKSGSLTACIGKKSARRLDIHDMSIGLDMGTKKFRVLHGYGAGFESRSDSDTGSPLLCSSLED